MAEVGIHGRVAAKFCDLGHAVQLLQAIPGRLAQMRLPYKYISPNNKPCHFILVMPRKTLHSPALPLALRVGARLGLNLRAASTARRVCVYENWPLLVSQTSCEWEKGGTLRRRFWTLH